MYDIILIAAYVFVATGAILGITTAIIAGARRLIRFDDDATARPIELFDGRGRRACLFVDPGESMYDDDNIGESQQ